LVGEHLSEEYEKLNPLKKVPVIDDHGFILRERYVDLRE
jgi:glutathione S-transferase